MYNKKNENISTFKIIPSWAYHNPMEPQIIVSTLVYKERLLLATEHSVVAYNVIFAARGAEFSLP
jgi:hypothetical protein